jgi:predicted DNA-binding transcriptional regulator AlpA
MIKSWPRLMRRKHASEYLGLSVPSFDRKVKSGEIPPPALFGLTKVWDQKVLDAVADAVAGDKAQTIGIVPTTAAGREVNA